MHYNIKLLRDWRCVIRNNIHLLCLKQKMTIRKLARLSGISEYLLDHYELGKNDISLSELLKIACAFEVRLDSLMQC